MTESHRPLHLRHSTVIGHGRRKGVGMTLLQADVVGAGDSTTAAATEGLRVVHIGEVEGDTRWVIGFLMRSEFDIAGVSVLGGEGEAGIEATERGRAGWLTNDGVGSSCGLAERGGKRRRGTDVGQEERK